MRTLPELQADFLRAILDASPTRVSDAIVGGAVSAEHRLAIYAKNAEANFLASLRASFPAVCRLVGDEYFTQCAREFRRAHPSRSGDLDPAGAAFPDYLAARHAQDRFGYLGDVARLEWLYHECLSAAEHTAFDLVRLAAVPADDYDHVLFQLHPSARLFTSPFPAVAIWEANVASDNEPELIDLDRGGDRVLLIRRGNGVAFRSLAAGEYAFLASLEHGSPFAAALAAAAEATEGGTGFDAAAVLPTFVRAGVIVDFTIGVSRNRPRIDERESALLEVAQVAGRNDGAGRERGGSDQCVIPFDGPAGSTPTHHHLGVAAGGSAANSQHAPSEFLCK